MYVYERACRTLQYSYDICTPLRHGRVDIYSTPLRYAAVLPLEMKVGMCVCSHREMAVYNTAQLIILIILHTG